MEQSLIIFSGLPGTGKSTIARWLSSELNIPLLRIDDIADLHGDEKFAYEHAFWTRRIDNLVRQVEGQINQGFSVIVDSVFMGDDRAAIRRTARKSAVDFYALHTFCSDEDLWRSRVELRLRSYPQDDPATWAQITNQRKDFRRWDPSQALFLDAVNSVEENKRKILDYIPGQGQTKPG